MSYPDLKNATRRHLFKDCFIGLSGNQAWYVIRRDRTDGLSLHDKSRGLA